MNKKSLAEVALLTESEAAKMFNMGTTRFKARYVARDSKRPTERPTERHAPKVQKAKKCNYESRIQTETHTRDDADCSFAFRFCADAESWAFPGGRIES